MGLAVPASRAESRVDFRKWKIWPAFDSRELAATNTLE
jgi:hypothetical protein